MKELLKNLLYLLCATLTLGITGCSDKDNEGDNGGVLPAQLQSVSELIGLGGKLEVNDEYEIVEEIKTDTAANTVIANIGGALRECYYIGTTRKYDISKNPDEFVLYSPWSDVIWPGGLVQGKSLKEDNVPTGVPIYNKRVPGKIFLSIVSGNEDMDEWYKETELRPANVNQTMNDLIKSYLGKSTPAYTSFKIEHVQSVEEMALKLGIDLKLFGGKLKTDFGSNWSESKTYVAVSLKQQFFTMTYEGPDSGLLGIFTDDITVDDIKNYTGKGNPLCYVSSVTYGRSFIMLYESTASSDSLCSALNASFGGSKSDNSYISKKTVNEAKCTMTQIGGDPVAGLEAVFGNFDKLKEFMVNGAKVSADNVGAPISFKINMVHDNTLARLSNTFKYSATEMKPVPIEPLNDVEINVFNFDMKGPAPDSRFTVSNHSQFRIKSIKAGHSKDGRFTFNNGGSYTTFEDFKTENLGLKGGLNVPIYRTAYLRSVPKDHKFRIECEVHVKSQAYRASTYKDEHTFTLIRDFEYNRAENVWEPMEKNLVRPFESLSISNYQLSRTKINFDLNFRFKFDNLTYPRD